MQHAIKVHYSGLSLQKFNFGELLGAAVVSISRDMILEII